MANMEYMNQYEKENIRQIRLKINRKTEPELLEWIEKRDNIQGYIKRLILEDMKHMKEFEKECYAAAEPVVPFNDDGVWACPKCKTAIGPYLDNCYCGSPIDWEKVKIDKVKWREEYSKVTKKDR